MSEIQRKNCYTSFDRGEGFGEMLVDDDGEYILHADIVRIFAWMVEHRVEFSTALGSISWFGGGRWHIKDTPNGDFLGAITGLMGGDDE